MMRACLLALSLALVAVADGKSQPESATEKLEAIKKAHKEAEAAFSIALQGLDGKKKEDVEKAERLSEELQTKQKERYAQAIEIARADPKSDAGFAALEWLLTSPQVYLLSVGKSAMELAAEHHAANPKITPVVRTLGWVAFGTPADSYPAAVALLKAVLEKNPNRTARGYAAKGLAELAVGRWLVVVEYLKNPNLTAEAKKELETRLKGYGNDPDKLAAGAEKALEALLKEYGDITEIGEWAKGSLFEMRYLRVGQVAPDIEGEDLDGAKFKLSDYRGKVVVLDFWGDW